VFVENKWKILKKEALAAVFAKLDSCNCCSIELKTRPIMLAVVFSFLKMV
jgi:hypothetical protein